VCVCVCVSLVCVFICICIILLYPTVAAGRENISARGGGGEGDSKCRESRDTARIMYIHVYLRVCYILYYFVCMFSKIVHRETLNTFIGAYSSRDGFPNNM